MGVNAMLVVFATAALAGLGLGAVALSESPFGSGPNVGCQGYGPGGCPGARDAGGSAQAPCYRAAGCPAADGDCPAVQNGTCPAAADGYCPAYGTESGGNR